MDNNRIIQEDIVTEKIKLYTRNLPYIYLKYNINSNRYRISSNYEFLNKNYDLKIQYIRDLNKIDKNNILFNIKDKCITLKDDDKFDKDTFKEDDLNFVNVYKYINHNFKKTIIFIFKRVYKDDINYSIFFSSDVFYSLNEYLNNLDFIELEKE